MKSKLLLSLLALSCLPAQLCATIIRAEVWQRPNGTRVIILGDTAKSTKAEEEQIIACVTHLKHQKNKAHVFIPHFYQEPLAALAMETINLEAKSTPSCFDPSRVIDDVHYGVCENRIPYTMLDLFTNASFNKNEINLKLFAQTLLDNSKKIAIPAALQPAYAEHLKEVQDNLPLLPGALALEDNDEDYATNPTTLPQWLDDQNCEMVFSVLLNHSIGLFSTTLAAHIADPSLAQKDIYIISQEVCITMMKKHLTALGYKHVTSLGITCWNRLDNLYQAIAAKNPAPQTMSSDEFSAYDYGIRLQVLNKVALNMNEVFKK